ncbi:MAG: hypothetical protein NZ898_11140 [Myxococcota bacterium]|nr:hypothetical protein [Myxococcota bacterium]MDW8362282.1 hypothetical protein [Myxococcales bacterium]
MSRFGSYDASGGTWRPREGAGATGGGPSVGVAFDGELARSLARLAQWLRIAAVAGPSAALLQLVAQVIALLVRRDRIPHSGMQAQLLGMACGGLIALGISVALAVLLHGAAGSLRRAVAEAEVDAPAQFVAGVGRLRVYFLLKATLGTLALLAACCLVVLLLLLMPHALVANPFGSMRP